MDFKVFAKNLYKMAECYGFSVSDEYLEMIFQELRWKITNEMIERGALGIMRETTKKAWNDAYGINGRPALADWINAFVPAKVERTIYEKCKITGATLARIKLEFPQDYLKELEKIQQERGKFEDSKTLNKKNSNYTLTK
jgi:hypothetical protein